MSRFYDALRQIGALPQTSVPAAHEEDGHADKRRKGESWLLPCGVSGRC